ncbi:MAG: hypothetical protein WCB75_24060, partial [Pseudolabrys sp.]
VQWDTRIGRENAAGKIDKTVFTLAEPKRQNAKNSTGPRSENGASAVQGEMPYAMGLRPKRLLMSSKRLRCRSFRKRFALSTRRLSRSADNQDLANA